MKLIYLAAAVGALTLSACDTAKENQVQENLREGADATRDNAEAVADAKEELGGELDGAAQDRLEAEADAVRDNAEAAADNMEDAANAADDAPNDSPAANDPAVPVPAPAP